VLEASIVVSGWWLVVGGRRGARASRLPWEWCRCRCRCWWQQHHSLGVVVVVGACGIPWV